MKVSIKWFLTGKVTPVEDNDEILSPKTTIAELKGLIQLRYGFSAREILILKDHLLENSATLESAGITGTATDPVLTAHVVRESELDVANAEQDDTTNDDNLQEFSHADFILAMKMLGKEVPVSDSRLLELRAKAPRRRPDFLNDTSTSQVEGDEGDSGSIPLPPPGMPGIPAGPIATYNPRRTEVYRMFAKVMYGLRREGVDNALAVQCPDVPEPFPFWDVRTPDSFSNVEQHCGVGEICLEAFYFGEFAAVKDQSRFMAVVQYTLETKVGIRPRTPLPLREAGCMYPLIACPIIVPELDATDLGEYVFEDFGKPRKQHAPAHKSDDAKATGIGGGGGGCAPQ